ncbi:hypothetical protein [Pontibacter sp. SGAir0037]|uniref:hypothetical protein n=1 Tax=Pontibacter sp. SGAir0037 TaxID=2571030 RepID=UPI001F0F7F5A|nr:hypothetical protein [Pontibacter sp. SGAir0037]
MRQLLFTLLLLFPAVCQAQDILIKRNGDELEVKVQEITLSEVKYKRFDNLEGPLISIAKQDVFMIKYENGTKDVFTNTAQPAAAQTRVPAMRNYEPEHLKLSGPRIGFTLLSQRYTNHIADEYDTDVNPFMTQFGWQFETKFLRSRMAYRGCLSLYPLLEV